MVLVVLMKMMKNVHVRRKSKKTPLVNHSLLRHVCLYQRRQSCGGWKHTALSVLLLPTTCWLVSAPSAAVAYISARTRPHTHGGGGNKTVSQACTIFPRQQLRICCTYRAQRLEQEERENWGEIESEDWRHGRSEQVEIRVTHRNQRSHQRISLQSREP